MGSFFSKEEVLDEVLNAPITEKEAALYTPAGKSCCWQDAEEYAFRLRQLQLINHAINILARETWKSADLINFAQVHSEILTFPDGNALLYSWSILANDPLFKPMELPYNRFKEFALFFQNRGGASKIEIKAQFETYLTLFMRIRDSLLSIMAKGCN